MYRGGVALVSGGGGSKTGQVVGACFANRFRCGISGRIRGEGVCVVGRFWKPCYGVSTSGRDSVSFIIFLSFFL